MNSQDLGRILKEARLSKKMTQNEVVGNFITRNMLSQIESGTAMPSVKTLEYLCNVLDIQLEALIDTESSEIENGVYDYLKLRKLFESESYQAVIDSSEPDGFCEECNALKAQSYLKLAETLSESEIISDNQKAVEYANNSKMLAADGIFSNRSVIDSAESIIKKCAAKLSQYYTSLI